MVVTISGKIKDYTQLTKMRLSALVVFSAATGYIIATDGIFATSQLMWLMLGGYLVTGSSNGFNQVLERDLDKLMDRTSRRPIPAGRMSVFEATLASVVMGVAGVWILWTKMNALCGSISLLSLLLYTLVYTPAKRYTPFAVLIGAFPGAFPPMLGWIAANDSVGMEAVLLYTIQFIWQFPHFWSIAWVMHDDYLKAGFRMLPSAGGRNQSSARQTLVYTACLIPMAYVPMAFNQAGWITTISLLVCGGIFTWQAMGLYKTLEIKAAHRLMFGSFLYLPAVQLAWMFEKLMTP
ncbi:MAG: heme o synthase [Bacteroidota bacterium]